MNEDTIAALATPPGRGGIGVIRISGPKVQEIAIKILQEVPPPRVARYLPFKQSGGSVIDEGIALFFPHPHSFTGEDILELQGHSGPVVLDILLQAVLQAGARLACPGEFSQRAFLQGKIDLAQAEAIADLINASSLQAAQSALRSMQGEFSRHIHSLLDQLIQLRILVEATIDFSEEEIDFIKEEKIQGDLQIILNDLQRLKQVAKQGVALQEGLTIVLIGSPNAGKSSLLNSLCGKESAIVSDIPGTTRDTIKENIHLDGMPLHIIDTAGLRQETKNRIEQEGIRRTLAAAKMADLVLWIVDCSEAKPLALMREEQMQWLAQLPQQLPVVIVNNKIDLMKKSPQVEKTDEGQAVIYLSAKFQYGIDLLKNYLKDYCGFESTQEDTLMARRRHLDALDRAENYLQLAQQQFGFHQAVELLAEDLRQAQQAMGEITGQFTADDLLAKIFSTFCIGK